MLRVLLSRIAKRDLDSQSPMGIQWYVIGTSCAGRVLIIRLMCIFLYACPGIWKIVSPALDPQVRAKVQLTKSSDVSRTP